MVHAWNPGVGTQRGNGRRGRLSFSDVLTLAAVSLVVVAISLPRLRGLALHENEGDALQMLAVLGKRLTDRGAEVHARAPLGDLLGGEAELGRRLEDWRELQDGRVMRHGYLFDVLEPEPGLVVVRGWPWRHGETGLGAFVWSSRDGLVGHANDGAPFSGPYNPPAWPLAGAWLPLPTL